MKTSDIYVAALITTKRSNEDYKLIKQIKDKEIEISEEELIDASKVRVFEPDLYSVKNSKGEIVYCTQNLIDDFSKHSN